MSDSLLNKPTQFPELDEWEKSLEASPSETSEFPELDEWDAELPTINPRGEPPVLEEPTMMEQVGDFVKEEVPQFAGAIYGAEKGLALSPTLPHPIVGPTVKLGSAVVGAAIGGFTGKAATEGYKVLSDDPNKPSDFDEAVVRSLEAGEEEATAELLGGTLFGIGSTGWNLMKKQLAKPSEGVPERLSIHERLTSHGGGLNAAQVVDNSLFHTVSSLVRFAPIGKESLGGLDIKNQKALNEWGNNLIGAFAKVSKDNLTTEGLARSVLTTLRDTDQLYRAVSGEMYNKVDDLMLQAKTLEPARYTTTSRIGPTKFETKQPRTSIEEIIRPSESAQRLVGHDIVRDPLGTPVGKEPIYVEEELFPSMKTDVLQPQEKITTTRAGRVLHKEGEIITDPATGKAIMRETNSVVDVSELSKFANKLIKASERRGKVGFTEDAGTLVTRLSNINNKLSFTDAHHLRSDILSIQNRLAEDIGTSRAEAIVSESVNIITHSMMKAIDEFGTEDAKALYNKARELYKKGSKTLNKKYIQNLFKVMDEDDLQAVGEILAKTSKPEDIRKIKKALDLREELVPTGFSKQKIMGHLQGAWLKEAFSQAHVEGTDFFNPTILEKIFTDKKTNKVYEELFKNETPKQTLIKNFVKAAKTAFSHEDPEMGWIVKYAQTGAVFGAPKKVGQAVAGAAGGAALWDTLGAIGTATFVLSAPKLVGKWLSDPEKIKQLTTLVNHDPTKAIKRGGRVAKTIDLVLDAAFEEYGQYVPREEKARLLEEAQPEEQQALEEMQTKIRGF